MLITPLPGANPDELLRILTQVQYEAMNRIGDADLGSYVRWAVESAGQLRAHLRPSEIERLVLTRPYWALLGLVGKDTPTIRLAVRDELQQRVATLAECVEDVNDHIGRWGREVELVVADTGVYVRDVPLEELDFAAMLDLRDERVHLLVPMVVLDELDRLKEIRNDDDVRRLARKSLRTVVQIFQNPEQAAQLHPADHSAVINENGGISRGEVTIELVFNPPGHVRLADADEELLDRALAMKGLAGRQVRFLTRDVHLSMRARKAGLVVNTIPIPDPDTEPTRESTRARRKRENAAREAAAAES